VLTPAEVAERIRAMPINGSADLHTPSDGRAERRWRCLRSRLPRASTVVTIHQAAPRAARNPGRTVSAVVTETGPSARPSVLLAEAHGRRCSAAATNRLPIGLVNATACRTTPAPEITMGASAPTSIVSAAASTAFLRWRCAEGHGGSVTGSVRYAKTFWPTYRQRRKGLKLSFGKSFFDQLMRAPTEF